MVKGNFFFNGNEYVEATEEMVARGVRGIISCDTCPKAKLVSVQTKMLQSFLKEIGSR
jgi:hypothetical protein